MYRSVYHAYCDAAGDKALIFLGSNKSNPVVELLVAEAFGGEPFVSQDGTAIAARRTCPIFLRYRDDDPLFTSCFGGLKLAHSQPSAKPGIYYEKPDGSWGCCEWERGRHDAAFVIYLHRESQGRMEMALGGFSGRATRLLARLLARRGDEFWPPVYSDEGLQIGAYVVKFALHRQSSEDELVGAELHADDQIIPLDHSVIARRMVQTESDQEPPVGGKIPAEMH
ncbi:MAG: hypothetical protein IT424_15040 [Pirellulales bacterium]|nr:hypothetical protein [Pirellulales bacterium]